MNKTAEINRVKIIEYIYKAVLNQVPQNEILKKLRGMIQDTPDFNIREKSALYNTVKRVTVLMYMQEGKLYNKQIKRYSADLNKIEEHKNSRGRKVKLATEMKASRANNQVFYMTSMHSNPAKDHAPWQGVIFVDRYWKHTLADDVDMQKKVAAYIRNHNTLTVQDICKAPVYMITRPYCKHFFIPLSTDEVLGASVNKIRKEHPEAKVRTHHVYYRKKYYKMRQRIHTVLEMEAEAAWDKKLVARNSNK